MFDVHFPTCFFFFAVMKGQPPKNMMVRAYFWLNRALNIAMIFWVKIVHVNIILNDRVPAIYHDKIEL